VAFKIAKKQPKARAADLPVEHPAAGLFDGEVMVDLGNGKHAALYVEHNWQKTGNGIAFMGMARWCDADGQTHLTPNGEHVETRFPWSVDAFTVQQYGGDDLAPLKKEVLLALMGEPPELMLPVGEDQPPAPLLDISPTVRASVSIRHAIESVEKLTAVPHAKAVLA
jgi:hypothetical protein